MKRSIMIVVLLTLLALMGCSKKQEPIPNTDRQEGGVVVTEERSAESKPESKTEVTESVANVVEEFFSDDPWDEFLINQDSDYEGLYIQKSGRSYRLIRSQVVDNWMDAEIPSVGVLMPSGGSSATHVLYHDAEIVNEKGESIYGVACAGDFPLMTIESGDKLCGRSPHIDVDKEISLFPAHFHGYGAGVMRTIGRYAEGFWCFHDGICEERMNRPETNVFQFSEFCMTDSNGNTVEDVPENYSDLNYGEEYKVSWVSEKGERHEYTVCAMNKIYALEGGRFWDNNEKITPPVVQSDEYEWYYDLSGVPAGIYFVGNNYTYCCLVEIE